MGYDVELDTRLPGCRHRIIQRNANKLWKEAGEPQCDGKKFWYQAESELNEHDGIVIISLV